MTKPTVKGGLAPADAVVCEGKGMRDASEIDRNTRALLLLGSRRVSGIGRLAYTGSGGSRVFAILALQLA